MARVRSPNYPAISLPDAIERIEKLHELQHQSPEERGVIAQHLGYSGLNGKSLKLLSALLKFGLLEKVESGDLRVSDLAINILFPEEGGRLSAITEAAFAPDLFSEIRNKWPDEHVPTDESLRAYLIRRQFSQAAIKEVIQNYRATFELVTRESAEYDSPITPPEDQDMHTPQSHTSPPPTLPTGAPFSVAITSDAIEVSGRLSTPEDIDKLVKILQVNKLMITPIDVPFDTGEQESNADESEE